MAPSTAVSSALPQEPLLGDTKPSLPAPRSTFIIRLMTLSDIPILGEHNRKAYWLSPINQFIAPRAIDYPEQQTRSFCQGIRRRYCNPNSLSLVACPSNNPSYPVGCGQFARIGDDIGARQWVKQKGILLRFHLYLLAWFFWVYDKISLFLFPDTISDPKNVATFGAWTAQDNEKYWKPYPERKNRWFVNSLVVEPDYQGLGVGRLLMRTVLENAQRERVPCGLIASPHGEFLYRKLGFEYLGDFCNRLPEEKGDEGGGIMCWFPEGWEGRKAD